LAVELVAGISRLEAIAAPAAPLRSRLRQDAAAAGFDSSIDRRGPPPGSAAAAAHRPRRRSPTIWPPQPLAPAGRSAAGGPLAQACGGAGESRGMDKIRGEYTKYLNKTRLNTCHANYRTFILNVQFTDIRHKRDRTK